MTDPAFSEEGFAADGLGSCRTGGQQRPHGGQDGSANLGVGKIRNGMPS